MVECREEGSRGDDAKDLGDERKRETEMGL